MVPIRKDLHWPRDLTGWFFLVITNLGFVSFFIINFSGYLRSIPDGLMVPLNLAVGWWWIIGNANFLLGTYYDGFNEGMKTASIIFDKALEDLNKIKQNEIS